jgi:hypothetical protein
MPVLASIAGDNIGGITSMIRYTGQSLVLLGLTVSYPTLAVDLPWPLSSR